MIFTGSITSGSPVVTGIADTTGLLEDMLVTGTGIPPNTRIAAVNSATQITLNNAATTTNSAASLEANSTFGTEVLVTAQLVGALDNAVKYIDGNAQVSAQAIGSINVVNVVLEADVTVSSSVTVDMLVVATAMDGHASVTAQSAGVLTAFCDLNATSLCEAGAKGSLGESGVNLDGETQVSAFVAGQLSETFVVLAAETNVSASCAGQLEKLIEASADVVVQAIAAGRLQNDSVFRSAVRVEAGTTAHLSFVGQGLGVCDVINDILLLWGIENARMSVEYLRERALNDLNAAMQLIWARAKDRDYFSRRTLTVNIPSGSASVELEQEVQNVLGPVRRASDKGNLRPLASRSQLDLFGHLFLGQASAAVVNGVPQAFFAERLNQNRPDNTKIILHVVPAPAVDTELLVDVAMECPRYEWRDYCTCTPLHIPHRYAESVLLPVCRHRAMSSHYFIKEERRELIENEYATAMQVLGLLDPQLKEAEASKAEGGAK